MYNLREDHELVGVVENQLAERLPRYGEKTEMPPNENNMIAGRENLAAEECLRIMVDRIVKGFDPLRIYLFGSRARGTARPDSDIDLIVIFNRVEDDFEREVAIRRILADSPYGKDIVVTTPEEMEQRRATRGDVLNNAMEDAQVLYERNE